MMILVTEKQHQGIYSVFFDKNLLNLRIRKKERKDTRGGGFYSATRVWSNTGR
jgi:hypothetical protein